MAKAAGLPNVVAAGWGHSVEPIQECHGFPRNPWMKQSHFERLMVKKMDVNLIFVNSLIFYKRCLTRIL